MNAKLLSDLLSYFAFWWLLAMAAVGMIEVLSAVGSHVADWLQAHRNINTEVPALAASVDELRKRQYRLETELAQVRRIRDEAATADLS